MNDFLKQKKMRSMNNDDVSLRASFPFLSSSSFSVVIGSLFGELQEPLAHWSLFDLIRAGLCPVEVSY